MFDVTRLKDALYNTAKDSGASVSYAQGCVVGSVSALMCYGQTWQQAWETMYKALPSNYRRDCLPSGWECYVVVVHHPTGQQYVLNKMYGCLTKEPVTGFSVEGAIETWDDYSITATPEWACELLPSDFTAYWMF